MTELDSSFGGVAEAIASRARVRPLVLITIGAVVSTMSIVVTYLFVPLLPQLQAHYGVGLTAATWIYTAMLLGTGMGFILMPRLLDAIEDRTVLGLCGGALVLGALIPGIIDKYAALIIGAFMLGFGSAAAVLPVTFLRRHFSEKSVAAGVTVMIMSTGSGTVLGMLGGSLAAKYLSLTHVFFLLAALFAVAMAASVAGLPRSGSNPAGGFGVPAAVWLIAWVTVVLLAVTEVTAWGKWSYLLAAAGLVVGAGWVLVERKSKAPTFDLSLVRRPFGATALWANFIFGVVDSAFVVLVAYYLQTPGVVGYGLGEDAVTTSLLLLPFALTMFISGKGAEKMVQQGRPGLVLTIGAIGCAAGLLWLALLHDQSWEYLVGAGLIGLGTRAGYSGSFAVPQLLVSEDQSGMATALASTVMTFGYTVGSAMVGLVLSLAVIPKMGVPKQYLYTVSYFILLVCALSVVLTSAVSNRRHPRAFEQTVRANGLAAD